MAIVAFSWIGHCEDVCSHDQFPGTILQGHKFLAQQEINKREFQPRH